MGTRVTNDVVLRGSPAALRALRRALAAPGRVFDFARLLPPPATLTTNDHRRWCIQHWGTVESPGPSAELVEDLPDVGVLSYTFETAAAAPIAFLTYVAARYPKIEIVLLHERAGEELASRHCWRNGIQVDEAVIRVPPHAVRDRARRTLLRPSRRSRRQAGRDGGKRHQQRGRRGTRSTTRPRPRRDRSIRACALLSSCRLDL
jgi:hypothetical protein